MKQLITHTSAKCWMVVLGVGMALGASGQQDPMFSQYMFNTLSVNSAYAGSAEMWSFTGIYRNQWVGIEGAPVTQTVTAHGPLRKESLAVGATFINDKHGAVSTTAFYGDFSTRITLSNKSRLSFGLKAGVSLYQADIVGLNPVDEQDPLFQQDLKLKTLPNFGGGVLWYSQKHYLGVSVPKLLNNPLLDNSEPEFASNGERQHFFLIGGLVVDLGNYVKFKPSFLVKAVSGAPMQFDVTTSFLFYERLWAGVMYRHDDAAGLLLQYVIADKLRVGYAYDYTISGLTNYTSGSHEIMLGFDLRKDYEGHTSPRYF